MILQSLIFDFDHELLQIQSAIFQTKIQYLM